MVQDNREKQDKLAESNLYIKNLDDTQTDDKLRQLFEVRCLPFVAACLFSLLPARLRPPTSWLALSQSVSLASLSFLGVIRDKRKP